MVCIKIASLVFLNCKNNDVGVLLLYTNECKPKVKVIKAMHKSCTFDFCYL